MNLREIEKLYENRQSCRKFDGNKKVDGETLKKVTELALLAPSACNSQPWRFIVTNKPETVKKIAECTQVMGFNKFTDNCTAFAVLNKTSANLTERAGEKLTHRDFISNDIGIVCAHFVLAAEAAGLSTCILGMFKGRELRSLLSIPNNEEISLVIAIGYAEEDSIIRFKKRKDVSETCEYILE